MVLHPQLTRPIHRAFLSRNTNNLLVLAGLLAMLCLIALDTVTHAAILIPEDDGSGALADSHVHDNLIGVGAGVLAPVLSVILDDGLLRRDLKTPVTPEMFSRLHSKLEAELDNKIRYYTSSPPLYGSSLNPPQQQQYQYQQQQQQQQQYQQQQQQQQYYGGGVRRRYYQQQQQQQQQHDGEADTRLAWSLVRYLLSVARQQQSQQQACAQQIYAPPQPYPQPQQAVQPVPVAVPPTTIDTAAAN
eukprot:TRINITY_DN8436_c0_g1_i1.p1 TRINITY_DN8436_c0_g1~~TRINITY_DN8436_c0_g1_i1.p1  ORF type:complete len:245 (+),score=90.95 TRINITY_DN8436_c0_g1_i1:554-1288(+)